MAATTNRRRERQTSYYFMDANGAQVPLVPNNGVAFKPVGKSIIYLKEGGDLKEEIFGEESEGTLSFQTHYKDLDDSASAALHSFLRFSGTHVRATYVPTNAASATDVDSRGKPPTWTFVIVSTGCTGDATETITFSYVTLQPDNNHNPGDQGGARTIDWNLTYRSGPTIARS